MQAPTTRRARRKAERPAEILDAAFEEFVRNGYAATRLEDVAQLAGVTKGTIYFYFDTKERVFEEMIRRNSQPICDELTAFIATLDGRYVDRLRTLIAFLYRRIVEDRVARETMRSLIAEGRRFPDLVDRHSAEVIQPFVERLRELLVAGIAAGEFRDTPALKFAEIILSPMMLLNVWGMLYDDRRQIDVKDFIDVHLDLLLNGLAIRSHPDATNAASCVSDRSLSND
ncbi:MAG: transcriptional regulator, TetR family [Tardiphaga sp.]|nr:transcriptional regulator, TetR family [Tardiphaga sp.]